MEIIPAIDIKSGRCVRLVRGDFEREEVFSDDPTRVAIKWASFGAKTLHVIDLDGAKYGEPKNLHILEDIRKRTGLHIQFGGGIRNLSSIEMAFKKGATRVILGTGALHHELIKEAVKRWGEGIMVAIDSEDGVVKVRGWTEKTDVRAEELLLKMSSLGIKTFLITDIKRDGTLTSPNFELIERIVSLGDFKIIASGGISKIEHIKRLGEMGVYGAVLGMALYKGLIDIKEAIKVGESYGSEV